MLDLFTATRDDLIRMLLAERDARQEVDARLARQEAKSAHIREAVTLLTEQLGIVVAANVALRAALGEDAPHLPAATPSRMLGHEEPSVSREARRQCQNKSVGLVGAG